MNSNIISFLKFYKELPGDLKEQLVNSMPVVNPDGRRLSDANIAFLAWQSKIHFTVVAGFRQWMKHGHCVKKGEHGHQIFVPAMNKSKTKNPDGSQTVSEELERFLVATVFDISQTFEIQEKEAKHCEMMSEVQDTNPIYRHDGEDFIDDDDEDDFDPYMDPWELETDCLGNCYSDADPGL